MEISNDDLLNEAQKIATQLKNEDKIKAFKNIETKINNNAEITTIFNKIRYLQRKLVKAEYYEKNNIGKNTEQELNYWRKQLNNHPLFIEYRALQQEVNSIVQEITKIFHTTLDIQLNKNT